VLGFLSHFPVAGVAWQTLHYLVGFQRLGFETYYVEAHGCTPSKLMQTESDDGAALAAGYISDIVSRFGFGDRWAYHAPYPEPRYFGMSESRLKELFGSASLLINLHGSHLPTPELTATGRLVYLGTDPVDVEVDLFHQKQESVDYLSPHCAFFTFGENLGRPDCRVPVPTQFEFRPTRQPVVSDFWEGPASGAGTTFTTIGNWRQPGRQVELNGVVYNWSKHWEFQKILDLPQRTGQRFELALASCEEADVRLLESRGWSVRPALEISRDLDVYRDYIGSSRGEVTVAKDQNVRLRSGWFSDRAVTYLAAGRPVITQDTGFGSFLPTGEGLYSFANLDEAVAAVEQINGDYERNRRAARRIAREFFEYDVVLAKLIEEAGISRSPGKARRAFGEGALPSSLRVMPVSRWPTRLDEATLQGAANLPVPTAPGDAKPRARASIVVVTHQALTCTKLCLATLLGNGWHPRDELIIVDNASTDGTREFLEELARRNSFVRVILNESNRGFARANTQGIECSSGEYLILLNNDTLLTPGWQEGLLECLGAAEVGMVGPVTNRTCNEAQIDAPYRTYGELIEFAALREREHRRECTELSMVALFCAALTRRVYDLIGPLDDRFEVGMFEDDDYSLRVRRAGFKILCAEHVFVHHFGQVSFGELCVNGQYDRVFQSNRARFEEKWGAAWHPHARRITPEYQQLRNRIRGLAVRHVPAASRVLVVSKGDEELLQLGEVRGGHFPQDARGHYANIYPADSAQAIAHLEELKSGGAGYLLIPKPAYWWLDFYADFKTHLESRCRLVAEDEDTGLLFQLGGRDG